MGGDRRNDVEFRLPQFDNLTEISFFTGCKEKKKRNKKIF